MPLLMNKTPPPKLLAAHRKLIGLLPLPLLRHAFHLTMIHTPGNFRQPRTFNEKVNWRILYDRRDRIIAACDKMRMKEMARAAYPGAQLRIPETYWYGTDLRDAPDLAGLPPWVLKPNHSSGHALFGPDPQTDVTALLEQTHHWWTRTPVCFTTRATWVFTVVSPKKSSAAISALDRPRAIDRSTSSSRLVRSARPGGIRWRGVLRDIAVDEPGKHGRPQRGVARRRVLHGADQGLRVGGLE